MAEVPGLKWVPKSTVMDMSYDKNFKDAYVGDAYERMFLNAALGDQTLFVSAAELVEMWRSALRVLELRSSFRRC